MKSSRKLPSVGWREVVSFPDWADIKMNAKIDTGARSSAIHAETYEVVRLPSTKEKIINEELRLKLKVGTSKKSKFVWAVLPS